jgi:hypothetical protein
MSIYATLLLQGAAEVREYKNMPSGKSLGVSWLDRLADDMEKASALSDQQAIERAIDSLAYRIIDSGPMGAFPSFDKALDALQRSRKKKHV